MMNFPFGRWAHWAGLGGGQGLLAGVSPVGLQNLNRHHYAHVAHDREGVIALALCDTCGLLSMGAPDKTSVALLSFPKRGDSLAGWAGPGAAIGRRVSQRCAYPAVRHRR